MMKVSIFAKVAMLVLLFAVVTSAKTCGSGSEGKAVRGNRYMSKKYVSPDAGFDWAFCKDWCSSKKNCRAWEFKSNDEGGRCDLHKKGYKWRTYAGQSFTYAGRCW